MVVASGVAAVRTEITLVTLSLEGHTEVVALGVHREAEVLHFPFFGHKEIESSHAGMTVRGEIEVTVGSEGGKHLVTRGVDGFAEVL